MEQSVGQRIRACRLAYGMSQAELARRAGISVTALYQIEAGVIRDPGGSRVLAIARVLKTTAGYLLGEEVC